MPVRSTTPCDTTVHTTQRRPGHNLMPGRLPDIQPIIPSPNARATLRDTGNQSPRFNGPASLLISLPFSFMQSSVISKALRLYLTAMALRCDLTNSRPVSNSGLQLQYTSIRTRNTAYKRHKPFYFQRYKPTHHNEQNLTFLRFSPSETNIRQHPTR